MLPQVLIQVCLMNMKVVMVISGIALAPTHLENRTVVLALAHPGITALVHRDVTRLTTLIHLLYLVSIVTTGIGKTQLSIDTATRRFQLGLELL